MIKVGPENTPTLLVVAVSRKLLCIRDREEISNKKK